MTKISILDIMNIFGTTCTKSPYKFLKNKNYFDFDSRELKTSKTKTVLKQEFEQWKRVEKKKKDAEMMSQGKMGRPKKVKEAVN